MTDPPHARAPATAGAGTRRFPGTQGYADQAAILIDLYEGLDFAHTYAVILPLLPTRRSRILDIGAGTGRDAACFAARGHGVTAVEPTEAFRAAGKRLHPDPAIDWIDDGLPTLHRVRAQGLRYDLVWMSGVWMHLDPAERRQAMPAVAGLLAPGGRMLITLRHGPVPEGRRMFPVTDWETIALAEDAGVRPILQTHRPSIGTANRQAGVTWTWLIFDRAD